MPEDTCVSLALDMDSCEPKKLCCGSGGAVAYNKTGACPPNAGYSIDSGKCQCCRPPCQPRDYRVTATFTRVDWEWVTCTSGNNCTEPGSPRLYTGASATKVLDGISNPNFQLEIVESPLIYASVCNCYVGSADYGLYALRFDDDCPNPQSMGMNFIRFNNGGVACEGLCNSWSVASSHYHTIDKIEQYICTDVNQCSWVTVG